MAVAFRAAGTLVDNAGAASITVTKPAGLTLNDFVIVQLVLVTTTDVVVSPPDNTWYIPPLEDNLIAGNNPRSMIFYHVATNSEPTWTFTLGAANQAFATSCAYSGVGSIDICGLTEGTTSPDTAPSITPSLSSGVILCIITNNNSGGVSSVTLDAGLTSRYNANDASTHWTLAMGDAAAPSAGIGSTAFANNSATSAWILHALILNPAGTLFKSEANICVVPTGTSTEASGGATTVAATTPAGIQNSDILVAFFRAIPALGGNCPNVTITAPVGWTVVREDLIAVGTGTFGEKVGLYTHAITNVSGEPATYTWTISSGTNISKISIDMVSVRGCSAIDTNTLTFSSGNVTTLTATGPTPTDDNEPVLVCGAWSSDTAGQILDCVNCQSEATSANGHTIWSTVTGRAAVAIPNITATGSVSEIAAVYIVTFLPVQTNTVKIAGFTVVNRYSAVTSQAITVPTGAVSGDLLIAHVVGPTGGSITPPAGWSPISLAKADDGNFMAEAFSHQVVGGDPASVTFSFSGATTGFASIIAFHGASTSVFLANNSTTQGLTPNLGNISHNSLILMYETVANNGTANGNGVGVQQSAVLTAFTYNPNARNGGNISRGGALSVILQSGPDGGFVSKEYRSAPGGISGPQMTIAVVSGAPAPPPPPPPPPPPGGPTSFVLPFHGQIDRLPSFPPVHSFHEVNLILKQKMLEISTLQKQIIRYASNPQQHYKIITQPTNTIEQFDVNEAIRTNENVPAYQSSDTNTYFPSTGFVSTLGVAATSTNVTVNNNTSTVIVTASPNIDMTTGDLVMAVVSGTWAAGMFSGIMDITYAGVPSSIIYFAKRLNIDAAGRFSDTQIFGVPSGVGDDTAIQFGLSQSSGAAVVMVTCTLYVGNLQAR